MHTKCRPSVANISLPGALAAPRCGLLVGWLAGRCSARRARPPGPLLLLLMLLLLLLTRRAIGDTNSPAKAAAPRVEINPLLGGDSVELDGGEKCRRRRRRRYLTCISLAHDTPHAARKLASSTALPNERTSDAVEQTNKQDGSLEAPSIPLGAGSPGHKSDSYLAHSVRSSVCLWSARSRFRRPQCSRDKRQLGELPLSPPPPPAYAA